MTSFIVVVHLLVTVSLIVLVLVQDAKGNGAFGIGGGSNSVLGATGAQSLAGKLTVYLSIAFALSCIYLAWDASRAHKSVIDGGSAPVTASGVTAMPAGSPAPAPTDATPAPAAPAQSPAPAK